MLKLEKYKELYRYRNRKASHLFLIEKYGIIQIAEEYSLKILDKFSIHTREGFHKISLHQMQKLSGNKFIEDIAIVKYEYPRFSRGPYIFLDNIQDFGNMGSIIRTCHAFGYENIIIYNPDQDFFHHRVYESSRYLIFKKLPLHFSSVDQCNEFLHSKNVIATGKQGTMLNSPLEANDVIVLGNETHGVNEIFLKKAHSIFTIPSEIESLNVSAAASIILYQMKLNCKINENFNI